MSDRTFIPFHVPSIGEEEIAEVAATLRSGWLTSGERTARFERDFRAYTGARHALAVNSCTAGLHLALAAAGIGPGDEVITTPLTFCATVNTILHVGATPVLADVLPDGNLDPASAAERITPRTRAIIPVHLGGMPCRMDAIWDLARRHSLKVIEDAAHAVDALYRGMAPGAPSTSGRASDAVAFSFYATKNITTGEGGMVTTNDAALADRMRVLCLHGISKDAWNRYSEKGSWYYEVTEPGFKYNLSDVQSAIGIHQLEKIERFHALRTAYAGIYTRRLAAIGEVETPPQCSYGRHAWHLYQLRLNLDRLEIGRDRFIEELRARGIGTSVHFIPIPLHPFFAPWARLEQNQCPRAIALYERLISLPLYPSLTMEQIHYVTDSIAEIAARHARRQTITAGMSLPGAEA
ncbi:MAG TPA: DegT/DnrJ/EryC1/StrS family aminotransferase [Bryobacteraceae bacterium]|jgi:dTDP-4-amino-4,6-dideoxygalactose transaminase|nr:DegT/DnrJ/EryC1/StrS family aminotransferase [Bryobacteraceae bacterium]